MARRKVFEGILEGLPPQESNTIRVFFSSTFTDLTEERNVLMKEAVPYLRNYCMKQGLDFQVVDMRWGVREEMSVDQMTTELCLKEVQKCQEISLGPNFVIFLGDRYGRCPLPSTIPVSDFKVFHHVAMAMDRDVYILDKWYLLDKNAEPPVYQIQPITNILPHYKDSDPENTQLQEKDQKRWEDTEKKLKTLFDQLGREAHRTGQMDQEAYGRYLISVTESEIKEGLLTVAEVKDRVLCFHRTLENIDIQHSKAWRFVDLNDDGSVNKEAKDLREVLILTKIPEALPSTQMHSYRIPWSEAGGIDPEDPEHASYLRSFSKDFKNGIQTMIDERLAQSSSSHVDDLYMEILHHLHFSVRKSDTFFGREKELKEILEKLTKVVVEASYQEDPEEETEDSENNNAMDAETGTEDGEEEEEEEEEVEEEDKARKEMLAAMKVKYHVGDAFDDYDSDPKKNPHLQQIRLPVIKTFKRPVVIYGESGSGKTALMAKVSQLSSTWVPGSALIVRYLGTSPKSSSIREVLINICRQIWSLYDVPNIGGIDLKEDFQYLISYFHALLWRINSSRKPLTIVMDSVDQLSPSDHSHTVNWLPTKLPVHVHVIVSMMPDIHGCLDNVQQHLPFPEQYCKLSEFSEEAGNRMVSALCSRRSRSLTRLQRNFLMEQFARCPQPLFLKLIVDEALTWKSFTPLSDVLVGDTVQSAINKLFDKLERAHGVVLISRAFGYLCAASQGLSDAEMEDILSLDDEVLQDTYLYHLPPDPEVIRLPPLLWKRISGDISEYLVEQRSGNQVVVNWYHRQFSEVAAERYLYSSPVPFHSSLAEYFSGKWSSITKPLELFKVKKGSYPDAFRQVPSQPLIYDNGTYNVRKLQELPKMLLGSRDILAFHQEVVCSFHWLYATCKELSLTDVFGSLNLALLLCGKLASEDTDLSSVRDDIKFVCDMLVLASDSIRRNPVNVAIQIVSQLSPQYSGSRGLTSLVREAYSWLEANPQPLLLPQGKAMPCPGGCLLSSINVDVNIQGNERVFRSCIEYNESKRELYVTEQRSNKNSDCLRIYDLDDNMSCLAVNDLQSKVRSIKFKVAEKFLIMETYDSCSRYSFTSHFEIFDRTLSAPYDLDCSPGILTVSATGSMLAWSDGEKVKIGKFKDKGRSIDIKHVLEGENDIYLLFSPDEQYLITYSEKTSKVYNCKSGALVMDLTPEGKALRSFGSGKTDFSRKVFVTSDNKLIHPGFGYQERNSHYVRQIPNTEILFHWEGYQYYEMDLGCLESSEEFFIAGSMSGSVTNGDGEKQAKVFNTQTGQKVSILNCVNGPYQDLNMFGEDELWVLVACPGNAFINVVSVGQRGCPMEEAVLMKKVSDHSQDILQTLVSSDQKLMFSASADNTIKLWDLPRLLEEAKAFHEESKASGTVVDEEMDEDFDEESDEDIDEGSDEDINEEKAVKKDVGNTEKIDKEKKISLPTNIEGLGQSNVLKISKSGEEMFIATKKGYVLKRDLSGAMTFLVKETLTSRQKRLLCATSSGKYVAVALKGRVLVLDVKTSEKVYNLIHLSNEISCLAEGGNTLIAGTAGMEGKARIWNLENGEVIRDVEFLYSFYHTAINSTGTKLIMTMFDYPFIFDVYSTEDEFQMKSQPDTMMYPCCAAGFSPDDRFAVSCSGDGTIRVMEADTNRYMYNMRQRSSITNMTFAPDSTDLLTCGYRSIYVWTLTDGSLTCKLTRHQSFIVCMEFARDGDFLVTSGQDKTIVIWDFRRKVSVCSFLAHCQVNAMTVTPDLSTLTYAPENVASVAELKPNEMLCQVLDGTHVNLVSESVKQAQALAFGFSGQTIAKQSSATCVIL